MKLSNSFVFILAILFLSIGFIDAKIITSSETHPLHVNIWDVDAIKQNQDFTFTWDTDQNGLLLNNTENNCSFFMIKQGATMPSFENPDAPNAPGIYGLYQTIKGGNFSTTGTYNVQIDCYVPTNTSISGNVLIQFDVTPTGVLDNDRDIRSIPYLYLSIIAIVLTSITYMTDKLRVLKYFMGMFLMVIGVMIFTYGINQFDALINLALGFIDICLGFLFLIQDAFHDEDNKEEIEED